MAAKRASGKKGGGARKRPTVIENGEAATVGTATKTHNMKARAGQIREAHRRLNSLERQLEQQRAATKGTNKEISAIYRQIKSDLGIERVVFEGQRRMAEMEKDVRDERLDAMREAFLALNKGEQAAFSFDDAPEEGEEEQFETGTAIATRTAADLEQVEAE